MQERLSELELLNDSRAAEVRRAQQRFALAMDQVSEMQTRLLDSEERRRELETAVDVVQLNLRDTRRERDTALMELASLQAELEAETGTVQTAASRERELARTLGFLTEALEETATAPRREQRAHGRGPGRGRGPEFRRRSGLRAPGTRVPPDRRRPSPCRWNPSTRCSAPPASRRTRSIGQVRATYSGQGGPLMPITMSTRGEEPDAMSLRANEVLSALDELNLHRIAAEQLPFTMPVGSNVRLTSGFGYRTDPINGGRRLHAGTDFAGPRGTPIYAGGDGTVVFAGRQSGYGLMVEIRHAFGITTRYAHLSRLRVNEGERVSRGDRIGDMGNTGRSTGTHLHYEVRRSGDPVNPMTFITAGRDVF